MSVRTKLLLLFAVFAAVPMIAMGVLGFANARSSLEQTRIAGLESTADLKVARIEAFFEGRVGDIAAVQHTIRLYDTVDEDFPIVAGMAGDAPTPAHSKLAENLATYLVALERTYGYGDIFLADVDGTVVYSSNEAHVPKHVGAPLPGPDNKAFEEGMRGIYLGDVFQSAVTPNLFSMMVSAPIQGQDGSFAGVVALEVDMDPVYGFVQETTGLGETGETLIARRTEGGALFLNPLRHDPGAALTRKALFGEKAAVPIQLALRGQSGSGVSTDYRGEEIVAVWRHISSLDWGLVAKIDTSEAFESVSTLRNLGLILGGVILIASGLMAFALSRAIVKPIRLLEEGARRFGRGELDHRVGTRSRDEIGRLSRTFDQMASDLQSITASRDELDNEVRIRQRVEEEREELIAELEAKNAELERFTYTASHDLKSPLITIRGFLGLLKEDAAAGESERLQADIRRISNAAEHMGRLLDELLKLSRIGRVVNPPAEVSLSDLARGAVALVANEVSHRGVQVTVADDLPVAYADRDRIQEVFQNLVENAIKFMGEQPDPLVEIGVWQRDEKAVCFVRDNGIGIDPRYRDKIFGLFDQLDGRSEGTGLGLTLVKQIVETHGGRIWVESEGLGQGSTFCFTLPLVERADLVRQGVK